ncbi:MAG TPA: J domain-containing protein [Spirochaetia bacterium]|nr:J domain-containing protein [Spirochaetia bacterium]
MDGFIDRLAELWRSLFGSEDSSARGPEDPGHGGAGTRRYPGDRDFQEAWEELDEYMRTGSSSARGSREEGGRRGSERGGGRPSRPPDESLRHDYANLEVPFGSDMEKVRASYKRLMMKYHPDKHAGSPEKQKIALEISKKINESFERIRSRHEHGG